MCVWKEEGTKILTVYLQLQSTQSILYLNIRIKETGDIARMLQNSDIKWINTGVQILKRNNKTSLSRK